MNDRGFSSRWHAWAWVRAYVQAACDAGREGLAAATPITRDQLCAQDPSNAEPARGRTGLQPDSVVGGRVGGLDLGARRGERAVCAARGLTGVTCKNPTVFAHRDA